MYWAIDLTLTLVAHRHPPIKEEPQKGIVVVMRDMNIRLVYTGPTALRPIRRTNQRLIVLLRTQVSRLELEPTLC